MTVEQFKQTFDSQTKLCKVEEKLLHFLLRILPYHPTDKNRESERKEKPNKNFCSSIFLLINWNRNEVVHTRSIRVAVRKKIDRDNKIRPK